MVDAALDALRRRDAGVVVDPGMPVEAGAPHDAGMPTCPDPRWDAGGCTRDDDTPCAEPDAAGAPPVPEPCDCGRDGGSCADEDGDGDPEPCDCDDGDPEVYPGQTRYFPDPYYPSGPDYPFSFDYDCDRRESIQLNDIAGDCEPVPGSLGCLGDGWLLAEGESVPGCGSGGAYQLCERSGDSCEALVLMQLQGCR